MQKCPKCNTWNENCDYCSQCNHVLNYELIRKAEIQKQEREEANKKKDAIDIFLHRMKHSRYILVKGIFYFFYSVWFVFAAIVSFFVALIAAGPG